jgi:Tfp pilus assembly protein PilF/predicted Ser/Thr protein kinase
LDCPAEETILAFAEGRLPAETFSRIQNHALRCRFCQDLLAVAVGTGAVMRSVAAGASVLDSSATDPAALGDSSGHALARGMTIGRYTILTLVGRGGVGEVYAAYDPELDRKVALKLLRAGFGPDRATAQTRLLREAKAIAKLAHPNVIAVYDAGAFLGRVFIAMEFVDGPTLKDWLAASPRSRAEILDAFMAAARGLSAAHAAGLVHRDFKPQNVMVAKDGTIRVMDFGLARQMGQGDVPPTESQTSTSIDDANDGRFDHWALKLTQTGIMQGTPAYMAPEQFALEPSDARTDQFAFCVALYEALYGQRPFAGDTVSALMDTVAGGRVRDAPAGTRVPARLRRVLLRGLQRAPDQRFTSMAALLTALQSDPTIRRRRLSVAVVLSWLVGTALGVHHFAAPRVALCGGGGQKLADIWPSAGVSGSRSPRREQIRRAFAATGKSYADQAFTGASRLLDDYVGRWLGMYRDACEATHVRGEQSAEVLDLRMGCLQERLTSVRALTDLLAAADGKTVENAVTAAGALRGLDRCADVPVLKAVIQPPQDDATWKRVEGLRGEKARFVALRDSGHCVDAKQLATALIQKTRDSGYLPLLAETLSAAGLMYNDCVEVSQSIAWLRESYAAAVESHDDEAGAEAATLLTAGLAGRAHKDEEARSWLRIAEASIRRLGRRPLLEAWWLVSKGHVLQGEGRYPEAVAAQREGLAAKERVLGSNHPDLLRSQLNLAFELQMNGQSDEALARLALLMEAATRILGPEHPFLGKPLNNEGELLNTLGRFGEARLAFRRAVDVFQKAGTDAEIVSYPLTGLGIAYLGEGHAAQAVVPLEQALKIRTERRDAPELLGEVRFALARALASNREDSERASSLARDARVDYAQVKSNEKVVATIDAWLRSRGEAVAP